MQKFSWKTNSHALVEQWSTSSLQGLVSAMVVGWVLAMLYEYLRQLLTSRAHHRHSGSRERVVFLLCQATLYLLSALIGNLLMLILMTYNLWLLITTVIGAGMGFFFIRPVFVAKTGQLHNTKDSNSKDIRIYKPQTKLVASSSLHYYPLLSSNSKTTAPTKETTTNTAQEEDEIIGFSEQKNDEDSISAKRGGNQKPLMCDDDIGLLLDSSPFKSSQEFCTDTII